MDSAGWAKLEMGDMMKNRVPYVLIFFFLTLSVFGQEKPDALKMFREKKYKEAELTCLEELKVTPRNMDSYTVLCWSLFAQNKFQESLKYAEKGMAIVRNYHSLLLSAGEALFYLGRNREALTYFERYAVFYPTHERIRNIYNYMGEIFIRLGEFNNADIAFSTALHYYGQFSGWWSRLAYAREMAKDYKAALEAYNKALQINPNQADARLGKERVAKLIG